MSDESMSEISGESSSVFCFDDDWEELAAPTTYRKLWTKLKSLKYTADKAIFQILQDLENEEWDRLQQSLSSYNEQLTPKDPEGEENKRAMDVMKFLYLAKAQGFGCALEQDGVGESSPSVRFDDDWEQYVPPTIYRKLWTKLKSLKCTADKALFQMLKNMESQEWDRMHQSASRYKEQLNPKDPEGEENKREIDFMKFLHRVKRQSFESQLEEADEDKHPSLKRRHSAD